MPGDFNFLGGEWLIKNRRLENKQWDSFDGSASVSTLLGGIASVEELRIPARNFSGMGLRLLDVERRLWADYWLNGQEGRLNPPSRGSYQSRWLVWLLRTTPSALCSNWPMSEGKCPLAVFRSVRAFWNPGRNDGKHRIPCCPMLRQLTPFVNWPAPAIDFQLHATTFATPSWT